MPVSIQFFGAAGYKIITSSGKHVVVDPFMDDNPRSPVKSKDLQQVDLLLITHNAFDHFGDSPKIIKQYGCKVVCAVDVLHNLVTYYNVDRNLVIPTIWGMSVEIDGVLVHPVESRHWSFAPKPDGSLLSGPAMGFVIEAGKGVKIYHPGDTALFTDMKLIGEYYKPNLGFMHVTLPKGEGIDMPYMEFYRTGELSPKEALIASEWMGLSEVVVSHYLDPECEDVMEFMRLVENNKRKGLYAPKTYVLKLGEVLEL
jgi:L-ascorbate metabolism protein UlaG (beta-lactamase superfamily)